MQPLKSFRLLALLTLVLFSKGLFSQTSPVTVTTIIGYPPTVYLPDYYSSGSNKLTANLLLNDFNEPSRDVYLKVKLESQDLRITTKPDYIPAHGITLYPGVLVPFSGDDFEEYLNYNNIIVEGIEPNDLLSRGGRLPEGFYTFTIEAYDFATHRLLSNSSVAMSHLVQNDPPTLLNPQKAAVVAPSASQNITFQWLNTAPVDPTNVYYLFTLYELIDPYADPMQAIGNNQSVIVHQEEVSTTLFNYNNAYPLLEIGKTYIYTVQALTHDGREMFKNNGVSLPSYFSYGYPGNGKIKLLEPSDNSALELTLEKIFSWSAPDKLVAGQTYYYEVRIAMIDSTRSFEDVLNDDSLLYKLSTPICSGTPNFFQNVRAHFQSGKKFVWQVKAYTEDQEIAKSEIAKFGGPPCILDFIAANEYVNVTFTDGCDLNDLTGTGTVRFSSDTLRHDVVFNHIRIQRDGVQYYLMEGEVLAGVSDMKPFRLSPENSLNGEALFYPDSIRLTRYDYKIKGHIEWNFPHAVDLTVAPKILSKEVWLDYRSFILLGSLPFADSTNFDLLDPMNFNIRFTEGSRFFIRGNREYFIDFIGEVSLPEIVKDLDGNTIVYPFKKHDQIYELTFDEAIDYKPINIANRTTLALKPKVFTLDLDYSKSPNYFSGEQLWKGLYFHSGTITFNGDYTWSKQFACLDSLHIEWDFDSKPSEYAYIVNDGLYLKSNIDFANNNRLFFNTFPAIISKFDIEVAHSNTVKGKVKGDLEIPLLNDTDNFPFTCNLSQLGFSAGYLDESIENKTFTYNGNNNEQKLLLTFNRGFFADNERIETTVTIEWPYLGVTFSQIPAFRIWGNYDIGFGLPNGAFTLATQLQTRIKGYEITIDGIGAGRQGNAYAIGTTAKIVMGEDVSGDDGPPIVNFYSIVETTKINESYVIGNSPDYTNPTVAGSGGAYSVDNNIGQVVDGSAAIGDIEAIAAKYEQNLVNAQKTIDDLKPKLPVGTKPPSDSLYRDFANLIPTSADSGAYSNPLAGLTLQEIIEIIDIVTLFLEPEQQQRVQEFKELLTTFSQEEIESFIEKFKDVRGTLNKAIIAAIDAQIAKVTNPIKQKVDQLNNTVSHAILTGSDTLVSKAGQGIDYIINGFTDAALSLLESGGFSDPTAIIDGINKVSSTARTELKRELHRAVTLSVTNNIVKPATGMIDTILYTGTVMYLANSLSSNAASLITNKDFKLEDIDIDFNGMVDSMSNYLEDRLTFDYFKDRIQATIDDIYNGFSWDSVSRRILDEVVGKAVEQFIVNTATDVVGSILGDDAGAIAGGLAANVQMDFTNIGDKLKSGDLRGIIKIDPCRIVVISPVVDIDGYVKFTEDDPIWGDSWQASLAAKVKKPSEFSANATFINGTKPKGNVSMSNLTDEEKRNVETFKYWFVELGVRDLKVPLTPIPLLLKGADGRIYHHMLKQKDNVTYLPHDSVKYGAGLRVYMMDAGSAGKIVDFNVGLELNLVEGGFFLEMNGQANIANLSTTVGGDTEAGKEGTELKRTIILADGFMRYNSIEKHFLANLNAKTNISPLLCASGQMVIDISKDWWQFSVGTREKPMTVAVLCRDTIFRGWFDVNKTGLDLGLYADVEFDLTSPWIDIKVCEFRGWAYFYYKLGAELVVFWQPDFGIQKGLVFVDVGAGVGIDYKTLLKSGSFTIAAINYGGTLEFATVPEAYLRGEVHGSVTVMNIKAGMSMNVNLNF